MRRVTAILSVAAVVLMAAGLVAQAKPSFAGEWKIVADPSDGDGGRGGGPGIDLTITQSATAMTVEYRS
jgi:Spy/CpxP family protein refolding chaperone